MLKLTRATKLTPLLASQLHAVWIAAYTQEAALLGARDFPPLRRACDGLLEARESATLAYLNGELAGAVVTHFEPHARSGQITALVVAPHLQRRGIARALVAAVIAGHPDAALELTTGAANTPALMLYRQFQFEETVRRHVGPERLELVTLHRALVGAIA